MYRPQIYLRVFRSDSTSGQTQPTGCALLLLSHHVQRIAASQRMCRSDAPALHAILRQRNAPAASTPRSCTTGIDQRQTNSFSGCY
jgi:hypothetical protein